MTLGPLLRSLLPRLPPRPPYAQAKQIQQELSQMQQDLSGTALQELGEAGRSLRPEGAAAKRERLFG